jgi:DNA-binding transcriptional LysR family regulator
MFHEIRYVYEVYRERSFSRAAQKLYISQPSLSAMVKRAEQRIGSPIFDRSTSPIGLTQVGLEYIRAAEQMMEIEDGFKQYLSDAGQLLTGSLSIGGTTLFTSYILPPLISAFSARYPAVEIRVHEAHTAYLEKELNDGALDLIAENYTFDPGIYGREPFCSEHLLLTVPADRLVNETAAGYRLSAENIRNGLHLRDEMSAVPPELFREEPFLLLKEGNDTRLRADRFFASIHMKPNIRLLLDQQITAYNLALNGMGSAFVSDTLVKHVPPVKSVWFYKLDGELSKREICFYYKRSRYLTSAVREFIRTVQEMSGREEEPLQKPPSLREVPSADGRRSKKDSRFHPMGNA